MRGWLRRTVDTRKKKFPLLVMDYCAKFGRSELTATTVHSAVRNFSDGSLQGTCLKSNQFVLGPHHISTHELH